MAAAAALALSSGHQMPAVGLGVWRMDSPAIRGLIHSALRAGYRHFDCAADYQNEAEVGDALAEAFQTGLVKREDLFITTKVIKKVRQDVLQGCKLVFSRVFPSSSRPQDQIIWKMAEQLGAICCADMDSTVTHVVAVDSGTEKARWAVGNNKILVHPRWIEASNFRWHRQQEEDFPVPAPKEKSKQKGKENADAVAPGPTES